MGLNLAILLKLFVDSAGATSVDLYEHVASVLCNVTHVKTARQIVLQRGRGLLNALLPQLSSTSETRRRGTAAAFKNCCMTGEINLPTYHARKLGLGGRVALKARHSLTALEKKCACSRRGRYHRRDRGRQGPPEGIPAAYQRGLTLKQGCASSALASLSLPPPTHTVTQHSTSLSTSRRPAPNALSPAGPGITGHPNLRFAGRTPSRSSCPRVGTLTLFVSPPQTTRCGRILQRRC